MEYKNLVTKKEYEQNGEKKTQWLTIGTLMTNTDGKQFVQLNMFPNMHIYVFDQKERGGE